MLLWSFNDRGDAKLLFSAANDGTIIAWGSGGAVHDKIQVSNVFTYYTHRSCSQHSSEQH